MKYVAKMFASFVTVLIVLNFVANHRHAAGRRLLGSVGADKLIAFAGELGRSGAWDGSVGPLPTARWPKSFAGHGILEIKRYFNGIQIVLERHGRRERGLYVTTDKAEVPEDGSGIVFEKLTDGIFSFEQKIRVPPTAPTSGAP